MTWENSNSRLVHGKSQVSGRGTKTSFISSQSLFISFSISGVMVFLLVVCMIWDFCLKRVRLNAVRMKRQATTDVDEAADLEESVFKTPFKTPYKTPKKFKSAAETGIGEVSTSETDDSEGKSSLSDIEPQAAFSPYHLAWTTPMPGAGNSKTSSTAITSTAAKALFNPSNDLCTIISERSLTEDESIECGMFTINECSTHDSIVSQERTDPDGNSCEVVLNSPDHLAKTMSKSIFTSGYASQLSEPPMSTPKHPSPQGSNRKVTDTSFQTPRLNSTTSSDYVLSASTQLQCNQTPIFSVPENTPRTSKMLQSSQRFGLDSNLPSSKTIFRRLSSLSSEEVSTPVARKYSGPTFTPLGPTPMRRMSSTEECADAGRKRSHSGFEDSLMWDSFPMRSSSESLLWDDYLLNPPSGKKVPAYDQPTHCNDLTYLSISVVDQCTDDVEIV